MLAVRVLRDNDSEAVLTIRELLSRGGATAVMTGVVVRAQRSFVADAGAPRLFREAGDEIAAVAGTLGDGGGGGGVDERNDFWRNTPGEPDGSTSGEILLKRDTRLGLKKFAAGNFAISTIN